MALTRNFRETVQARVRRDLPFGNVCSVRPSKAFFPARWHLARNSARLHQCHSRISKLAAHTKIHVKTLHQMFGPSGNPTAGKLFGIVAYLQRAEGVRFQVRSAHVGLQ